jgi:hypothetical protein
MEEGVVGEWPITVEVGRLEEEEIRPGGGAGARKRG